MTNDDPQLPMKPLFSKQGIGCISLLLGSLAIGAMWAWFTMIRMPGSSFEGPLPPITNATRERAARLQSHVHVLATEIGARSTMSSARGLERAEQYVQAQLAALGYEVKRESFEAHGVTCTNLIVEARGTSRPQEIVVVGAHYDSYLDRPAANDNASGTAALIELASMLRAHTQPRTLRIVAFTNEEPPHFQDDTMGSFVNAKHARERGDDIIAMLSLETVGMYDSRPGTQHYPAPLGLFYPDRADFISFVGRSAESTFVRHALATFRRTTKFPSEGAAPTAKIAGVSWSDHWSYWQHGYRAMMITDSALFRDDSYHTARDTESHLNYEHMARMLEGVDHVVRDLLAVDRATLE